MVIQVNSSIHVVCTSKLTRLTDAIWSIGKEGATDDMHVQNVSRRFATLHLNFHCSRRNMVLLAKKMYYGEGEGGSPSQVVLKIVLLYRQIEYTTPFSEAYATYSST